MASPLTYSEWVNQQDSIVEGISDVAYTQYLKEWYKKYTKSSEGKKQSLKQDFVQLLKDLNFLFGEQTTDPFLSNINYDNDEDLIIAVPYFAKKLKQVCKVLNAKREAVKKAKARYNLIGSNLGLENLLQDYILEAFTSRQGAAVHIPSFKLQNLFPELSAVKNDFYIEIEELHDPKNYLDSDPSVDINQYVDFNQLDSYFPLENISEEDVIKLVQSRFLPRATNSPLLKIFQDYLLSVSETPSLSGYYYTDFAAKIAASRKYISEPLYGISAVRVEELNKPDDVLTLEMASGSNWFLWPSGFQSLENTYNNVYEPINLISSSFVESGATASSSYDTSDLIFSDKNGLVEGAWLVGEFNQEIKETTQISLKSGEITEFLFPYVGFELDSKSLKYKQHSFIETDTRIFNTLSKQQQHDALVEYYNSYNLPTSTVTPLYLNYTTLALNGARAGKFQDEADNVLYSQAVPSVIENFNDSYGSSEAAFLYKFDRTDLPISPGYTPIYWPLQPYDAETNFPISYKEKDCLPIRLVEINVAETMSGAVPGITFDQADVIYKFTGRSTDISAATEAAWLCTDSVTSLNVLQSDLDVYLNTSNLYTNPYGDLEVIDPKQGIYNTKNIKCADCISGPALSNLAFKAPPGSRISFIWTGKDTYADQVFNYVEHSSVCPYGQSYPHDYYDDLDYSNPISLKDKFYWKKCNCKSVNYSPIGHSGERVTDFKGLADCLYADPYSLGSNFTFTKWQDTRGLNYKESPQFAFFQLDQTKYVNVTDKVQKPDSDTPVGYGFGTWKTSGRNVSGGHRMILKTGRQYTYYRSNLNHDTKNEEDKPPYLVCNYKYKSPASIMCPNNQPMDVVLVVDGSRSQWKNFDHIKEVVGKICVGITKDRQKTVQVGVIYFNSGSITVSYLDYDGYKVSLVANSVIRNDEYPSYQTNISVPFIFAQQILTSMLPEDYKNGILEAQNLCRDLKLEITNLSSLEPALNLPQSSALKKIIFLSDGVDTSGQTEEEIFYIVNKVKRGENILNPKGSRLPSIEITSIGMGPLAAKQDDRILREIASSEDHYFNLERYLRSGDGGYEEFVSLISRSTCDCKPLQPVWMKAIRSADGYWVGTFTPSDMVLNPGDYLMYEHKNTISYNNKTQGTVMTRNSISFAINVKLEGWDYNNSLQRSISAGLPPNQGAKPFWATIPTDTIGMAGQITFFNDYVPIHQPEVSKMVLNNGGFVRYINNGIDSILWKQPVWMNSPLKINNWCKINLLKEFSNLEKFLKTYNKDQYIETTLQPSDMMLESYSEYKPARYHYIARKSLAYNQNLYLKNKCRTSFVFFNSSTVLEPLQPSANLGNVFYPTVANISFPQLAKTEKELGGYLLPENLGASFYRGRGFSYTINENSLSSIDALSAERVFLDPSKYGSHNRGLTKKDQQSPVVLEKIENKWVMEPFGSGSKAGVIVGALENQKFTPYQSGYEINKRNDHGLARQEDNFQFWDFVGGDLKWNGEESKTSFDGQIQMQSYGDRIEKLLINKGTLTQWRNDIFGNDYGLYKKIELPTEEKQTIYNNLYPVTITYNSAPVNAVAGEYRTLMVKVSGTAPFSYQWYKFIPDENADETVQLTDSERIQKSEKIKGANGYIHVLGKVDKDDEGIYFCHVSNVVGEDVGLNIPVNIFEEEEQIIDRKTPDTLSILSSPQNKILNPGQSTTLQVVAAGTRPIKYMWRKNGVNLTDLPSVSPYLAVTAGVAGDSNNYDVIVSNPWGELTSSVANVGVRTPVTIVTQPETNITLNPNDTYLLHVSAVGTGPFKYQWCRKVENEAGEDNLFEGIENGVLDVFYVSPSETNFPGPIIYQCIVSNDVGRVISQRAEILVRTPISITQQPIGQSVLSGQTITFNVEHEGTAPIYYQWYKNGVPIIEATSKTYTTPALQDSDHGNLYKVKITNLVNEELSEEVEINVGTPVSFIKDPQDVLMSQEDLFNNITIPPITLTAETAGTAPIYYQWYKDGILLNGENSSFYNIQTPGIDSVGTYVVEAYNRLGSVLSKRAFVSFEPIPKIDIEIYETGGRTYKYIVPEEVYQLNAELISGGGGGGGSVGHTEIKRKSNWRKIFKIFVSVVLIVGGAIGPGTLLLGSSLAHGTGLVIHNGNPINYGGGGGGSGGKVVGSFDVTPGEELIVHVGAGGAPGFFKYDSWSADIYGGHSGSVNGANGEATWIGRMVNGKIETIISVEGGKGGSGSPNSWKGYGGVSGPNGNVGKDAERGCNKYQPAKGGDGITTLHIRTAHGKGGDGNGTPSSGKYPTRGRHGNVTLFNVYKPGLNKTPI